MKNRYEVRGDVTAIFVKHSLLGELEALIDTSDLEKVMSTPNTWCVDARPKESTRYVRSKCLDKETKERVTLYLHRVITNAPRDNVVDHINHNGLDNRRSNLNVTNQIINGLNRVKASSRNVTSGFKNVAWSKKSKKWSVFYNVSGQRFSFGYFCDLEEAKKTAETVQKLINVVISESIKGVNVR